VGPGGVTVVLVHQGAEVASWPLPLSGRPLDTVEGLARLQLGARRVGCAVRLFGAPAGLRALLDVLGLADVLGLTELQGSAEVSGLAAEAQNSAEVLGGELLDGGALQGEVGGQAEVLEQFGEHEAVQPGDPVS
jgi:hypothetical protein